MTNYEHYKKELESLGIAFAINKYNQQIGLCDKFLCEDCLFEDIDTCDKAKLRWVCEEYMGPDKKCNVDIITKHTKVEEAKKKGV